MIAGVCGGLGRHTGIDPIVFRVVLAVLAIFGIGLLSYAAAWLFLPADGDTASPMEALVGRGQSTTSATKTVLLIAGGLLALGYVLARPSVSLLALVVVGVVLLLRQRQQPGGLAAIATGPSTTTSQPPPSSSTVPLAYAPHGPYAGPYEGTPPPTIPPPPPPPYFPPPPKRKRQRSYLGRIVFSVILVVVGTMAAIDHVHGVDLGPAAYAAAVLAVIGAGLVVGAWFGRARGLIGLGILLSLVVATASTTAHWSDSGEHTGDRLWAPTSAQDIHAAYRLGAGDLTLDLRGVDFADASVTTRVHLGVGQMRVLLPSKVDTTVEGSTGIGTLQLLDKHSDGTGLHDKVTDLGADGAGGGSLKLFIDDGIGDVEVTRE